MLKYTLYPLPLCFKLFFQRFAKESAYKKNTGTHLFTPASVFRFTSGNKMVKRRLILFSLFYIPVYPMSFKMLLRTIPLLYINCCYEYMRITIIRYYFSLFPLF